MTKRIVFVVLVIFILSACQSSTLSFSEIEVVPDDIQNKIAPDLRLQSINESGKGYYIVFHSYGEIEADLEAEGETITIKFNETNPQDAIVKQNVFYLTTDPTHDIIHVLVNGKSTPFDRVTIL